MTTWHQMGREARTAANILVEAQFRSCLSRAYYAAYSKVTHELAAAPGIKSPAGREGPHHSSVRRLIETSMPAMTADRRVKLSEIIGALYALRVYADYHPSIAIGAAEAREAVSMMNKVFNAF